MKPLERPARALIDRARAAENPTDEDRRRVRMRVMAAVAAGAATAAVTTTAATAAGSTAASATVGTSTLLWAGVSKSVAIGAIAGLVAIGGSEMLRAAGGPESPAPLAPSARVAAMTVGKPAVPRAAESVSDPPPPKSSADVKPAKPAESNRDARAPGSASLKEEVELLKEARRAMATGDDTKAKRLLDEHADRFKSGALKDERLAARAMLLCQQGPSEEARRAAAQFFAEAQSTVLAERVRAACARLEEKK